MARTVLIAALAVIAGHEEGGSSMNAPAANGPELAIDFALADDELVVHKALGHEALFACIKLTLHPEEGEQQWALPRPLLMSSSLPFLSVSRGHGLVCVVEVSQRRLRLALGRVQQRLSPSRTVKIGRGRYLIVDLITEYY